MLGLLLFVIGCYVAAALSVHLAYRLRMRGKNASRHYVLIADRQQSNMEWYMRSLFSFSRRMGKDVKVTVVDSGATEETLAIVDRMARSGNRINVHALPSSQTAAMNDKTKPESGAENGESGAMHLMWMLQAEGVVKDSKHAVLIDLQNPSDLSKMPF